MPRVCTVCTHAQRREIDKALVAGAKVGPYEILRPLGAGGMGEVYRARDTKLARELPRQARNSLEASALRP